MVSVSPALVVTFMKSPSHRNLTAWAENGVLMLNTCLTVRAGEAGSHSKQGWEEFTDKVVDVVDRYGGANLPAANGGNAGAGRGRGCVFLCWGAWAAKRVAKLDKVRRIPPSPSANIISDRRSWLNILNALVPFPEQTPYSH